VRFDLHPHEQLFGGIRVTGEFTSKLPVPFGAGVSQGAGE
jgi:hypothetical protein